MERLLRSGILLGASVLMALFLGGPALADNAPGAAAPATGPAIAMPASAAKSKPMMEKHHQMMEKHHQMWKHHKGMSLAMRKEVQTALNSHGAMLKVDGKMGKQSREAIKKFQSENGLKVTGWLNKATLEKLGVKK